VVREDGKFCVVSYKSQHKVCFRFFSGAYQQQYFVNENGNVPESWDGIAQQLDANRVLYTKRKISQNFILLFATWNTRKPDLPKS
jgi:hypothetical protein